jgi:hypothetical protein
MYMALIACRECGASMSDNAAACPQCGAIGPWAEKTYSFVKKISKTMFIIWGSILIAALVIWAFIQFG